MSASTQPAAPHEDQQRRTIIPRLPFILAGLAVFFVLVVGGYAGNWAWTGFSDNDTLWDWLRLLLLPFIIATIPIWLEDGEHMDPRVRRLVLGVVAAFAVLVVLGYLVPLKWTGFTGNTLWDWLGLVMLPFAIATIRLWGKLRTRLDTRHYVIGVIELTILVAVVLAGYLIPWTWTGFTGNTLWDWIQLLIVPILLPTVLMPAARDFIKTGVDERRELAEGVDTGEEEFEDDLGYATPHEQPGSPEPSHAGRTAVAAAAVAAVLLGGVAGAIAFGNDGNSASNSTTTTSTAAAPGAANAGTTATGSCNQAGATTLAASADGRVVREGRKFIGCLGNGRPIALATGRPGTSTSNFAVSGGRVAFTVESCNSAKTRCATKVMVARARDGRVFNPQTFDNERAAGLALTPGGGMAVMLRNPAKLVLIENGQTRDAAGGAGLDPDSLAQGGSTIYWRTNGQPASAQLDG